MHCECAALSLSVKITCDGQNYSARGKIWTIRPAQTEAISTAIFLHRIFALGNPEEIDNSNIEARSVESRLGRMEATGSRLQIAQLK